MIFRALSRSLLAVLFAVSGKAQFEIRGSRLYLDGNPFPVRGVAYSPTPIGATAGSELRVSGCLFARDLPLTARAGVNTLRVYGRIPPDQTAFWRLLEANNLYLLAGFPLDPYHDPSSPLANLKPRILLDFRQYAEQLRDRKRVIAIVLGNEAARDYNTKFAGSPRDFYGLLEDAAAVLRAALGSAAPLLTTAVADIADLGQAALGTDDARLPGLSFWSVNVFRGVAFDGVFEEVRRRTAKPLLVSEFGLTAWDNIRRAEDPDTQAAAVRNQLRLLADAPVLGAVAFEWHDEWWRSGPDPSRHGAAEAGWFGLFGLSATGAPGLDSLRPRPAFTALAEAWGGSVPQAPAPRLRQPAGVVNAGSGATTIAPGGLISLHGEDLAEVPQGAPLDALPLHLGLTSVCLASRPAPLLFAGSRQINAQAPWETLSGPATALVYRAGQASNPVSAEVRLVAPGILDGGVVEAGRPCPVTVENGVYPGSYLEVYATGLGPVSIAPATGAAAAAAGLTENTPRAFLGSAEIRVLYSGLIPGVVGLYQTNVHVPEDYPTPSIAGLRLFSGGVESNDHRIGVIPRNSQPGLSLSGPLNFTVQPGGPAQSALLSIQGRNRFCELVRFTAAGLPGGVELSVPVGFPGRPAPVTVQAMPYARPQAEMRATLSAVSSLAENPSVEVRITVLPSRGDIPFRVVSGGARAGLVARFEMAGRVLYEARGGGPGRGFSFVTLNGETGILGPARTFDTWGDERASGAMSEFLYALPVGTVVLGAVADEGTLQLTARARAALKQVLGAQWIDSIQYQDSWAIISRAGASTPVAEGLAGDRPVILERILTF